MGAIISRFRKSQTTIAVLEDIDQNISHLEKFRKANQELRQKVIGKLIFYSVIFYIVGAFTLYFFFMPQEWIYKIYGLLPFLLFPFLVYLLKRFLHWFFVRKITQNEGELQTLKERRKDILESVMETETYKKAKEILEKFDPETKQKLLEEKNKNESDEINKSLNAGASPQPGLRRRQVPGQSVHPGSPGVPVGRGRGMGPSTANQQYQPMNGAIRGQPSNVGVLPRPILPLVKTPVDKLMDYMIGDGASHRYALICRNCCNHNGMALKEEFEYLAFRCAYCRFFNPSRKQRPNAPLLPMSPRRIESKSASSDNEEEDQPSTSAKQPESQDAESATVEDEDSSTVSEDSPTVSPLESDTDVTQHQQPSANSTDTEEMEVENEEVYVGEIRGSLPAES